MRIFKLLFLPLFVTTLCFTQATALAFDPLEDPCRSGNNSSSAVCQEKNSQGGENPVAELLGNIARIVAFIGGAVSVIMIMYGGFKYITSGGDTSSTTQARKIITWALVGLVVSVAALTITSLIINNFVVSVLFLL